MSGGATSPGACEAGRYLAELLQRDYRIRWDRPDYVTRARKGDLHHAAIAHVLAERLQAHPREGRPRDREIEPYQLLPLVSYALRAERLSHQTLQLFIDAFGISEREAERLWRFHGGTDKIRVLISPAVVSPETAAALHPNMHHTHSVHDFHYLGADGLPFRHETLQVIEAAVAGMDRYPYAFDTDALAVEVLMGGRLAGPVYSVRDNIYAVDILLTHPLAIGERCTLKYETTFHYADRPRSEFRRAVRVHVESVDIRVTFHPAKLPKNIRWAVWDSLDGKVIEEEVARLDEYHAVHRYLESIENTVIGFAWDW